ncbi:hypothetical protein NDU88_000653 [Pleurodeles waltl]|uniref:Uncharacterized protein n=1 Tax=Pleurodeles waltl TaxID=8319 RepID=A0AAV7TGH5_PLEWA|nr:hypothetical protein NDU88_000653 [Pleurodeles waltl]
MLPYPARLKVIAGGTTHFFEMPEDVCQWLEMWDKAPKERLSAERTGVHGRALRGSSATGGSPAALTQPSPVEIYDGRVAIRADGTMALAVSDEGDAAPATTSLNQELMAQRGSRVEDDMC